MALNETNVVEHYILSCPDCGEDIGICSACDQCFREDDLIFCDDQKCRHLCEACGNAEQKSC